MPLAHREAFLVRLDAHLFRREHLVIALFVSLRKVHVTWAGFLDLHAAKHHVLCREGADGIKLQLGQVGARRRADHRLAFAWLALGRQHRDAAKPAFDIVVCPLCHSLGAARVDARARHLHLNAGRVLVDAQQLGIQLVPDGRCLGVPVDHHIVHRPRFLTAPPSNDFQFDAVQLHVDAGSEQHRAGRQRGCVVILGARHQRVFVGSAAACIFPGFGQHIVDKRLKAFRVSLGLDPLFGNGRPAFPADGRVQRADVVAHFQRVGVLRAGRAPLASGQHVGLVVLFDHPAALRAGHVSVVRARFSVVALGDDEMLPFQDVEMAAVGARHIVFALVGGQELGFDPAHALH